MKKRKLIAFGIISLLSIISFGNCATSKVVIPTTFTIGNGQTYSVHSGQCVGSQYRQMQNLEGYDSNGNLIVSKNPNATNQTILCMGVDGYVMSNYQSSNYYLYDLGFTPSSDCSTCPTCEVCQECQVCPVCTGYNLSLAPLNGNTEYYSITGNVNVVVNDGIDYELDSHNNALWLSVGLNTEIGGQCSGDVIDPGSGNWSALFINNIQHESAPLINLIIPEEFERDYTNNNDVFNLWVSGYNVDTAYIDGIITTQKTLPDKQDFNNTISGLLPLFIPGLVIISCLYFIFRFIKKVF